MNGLDKRPRREAIDNVPLAYGFTEEQMRERGLFVSRAIKDDEPAVFNEPPCPSSLPTAPFTTRRSSRCPSGAPAWTTSSAASTTGRRTTTPPATTHRPRRPGAP